METRGKVFRYKDNVDTDVIIPARYLNTSAPAELAAHCMEDIDTSFVKRVEQGDIIVADKNFGCGSSREHAPLAIKASGIGCVIARSFARIFYRNAINIGIKEGDIVSVNFDNGVITNETKGESYQAEPFPPFMQALIKAGGLASYMAGEGR